MHGLWLDLRALLEHLRWHGDSLSDLCNDERPRLSLDLANDGLRCGRSSNLPLAMIEIRRRRCAVAALVVSCVVGLVSCGNDDEGSPEPRPLTVEEATRLAEVQFDNYDTGGARFEVATTFTATNDTLYMSGVVDWKNHEGRAEVRATGAEAGITEVWWNENVVLERRPSLDPVLAGLGYESVRYLARPPATSTRQIDRAIAIVMALASEERQNPVLIQQEEGSAFVREDALRESDVEVLRYGQRNQYWLNLVDATLMRFDGNSASGSAPIVVDLLQRGTQEIPRPQNAEVLSIDAVPEIYESIS